MVSSSLHNGPCLMFFEIAHLQFGVWGIFLAGGGGLISCSQCSPLAENNNPVNYPSSPEGITLSTKSEEAEWKARGDPVWCPHKGLATQEKKGLACS
jgi:hypothetical protein